ncbi:hypothetical protein RCG23_15670 [Neobacillus sp. PS3-34]|uniref:hypothetical protein n=1 Tax=Neobacillus sp. PS3-34 TaxID=3070678 RepID=UPI0027E01052|nr:hypothetical protein [Neobacillus sp. PS3-34]WML47032.1 hypothetical protein RCG23_15670 [Neobacillus sp. PS3-34]
MKMVRAAERHKNSVIHSPATTGGSPMPILMKTNRIFLPVNRDRPRIMPSGRPISVLIRMEVKDTFNVSNVMLITSWSEENIIFSACLSPSIMSSISPPK